MFHRPSEHQSAENWTPKNPTLHSARHFVQSMLTKQRGNTAKGCYSLVCKPAMPSWNFTWNQRQFEYFLLFEHILYRDGTVGTWLHSSTWTISPVRMAFFQVSMCWMVSNTPLRGGPSWPKIHTWQWYGPDEWSVSYHVVFWATAWLIHRIKEEFQWDKLTIHYQFSFIIAQVRTNPSLCTVQYLSDRNGSSSRKCVCESFSCATLLYNISTGYKLPTHTHDMRRNDPDI